MISFTRPLLPPLPDFQTRLQEIWSDGWLTNRGKQLERFETRLKQTMRCEQISLFCNGTIALLLGLRALRLQGEVITTPFTFPATIHAIQWAGLTPVFCDIDPVTMCLDPRRVEEAITEKTTAILAVHVFGIPCDVKALEAIARKHHLKLVFDAAHAFGVEISGTPIGDFGDMSMFSFHATKLFHTAEGGALVYQDKSLASDLHLLHNFGIPSEDHVLLSGINGKMNEIQAALGLCVLDLLDEERRKRAAVAARYLTHLTRVPGVSYHPSGSEVRSSLQYMPIRIHQNAGKSRDEIYQRMRASGILARRYFYPLCSRIECYAHLPSAAPSNLPQALAIEKEILCLPFHGDLSDAELDQVCEMIRN